VPFSNQINSSSLND